METDRLLGIAFALVAWPALVGAQPHIESPDPHLPGLVRVDAPNPVLLYDNVVACEGASDPLPIVGHPQLVCYPDRSWWPWFEAQLHWAEPGINPYFTNISLEEATLRSKNRLLVAHTHVGARCPAYASLAKPITCDLRLMLFNTPGNLYGFNTMYPVGHGVADVGPPVWDDGPANVLVGNPTGLVTRTGHFLVTPTGNGWFSVEPEGFVGYANGSQTTSFLLVPMRSVADLTKPEEPFEADVSASSAGGSLSSTVAWAGNIGTRTFHPIPNVPTSRWVVSPFSSSPYGSAGLDELANTSVEQRRDMHLHAGDIGFPIPFVISRRDMEVTHFAAPWTAETLGGAGLHEIFSIRDQFDGPFLMSTLLHESVLIDPMAPGSDVPIPPPVTVPPIITPPPPIVKTCSGTLRGTSADNGVTVTQTGIDWVCK